MRLATSILLAGLASLGLPDATSAQSPQADLGGVQIREVVQVPDSQRPVRLAQDPTDGAIYILATSEAGGTGPSTSTVYRLDQPPRRFARLVAVLGDADHATPRPVGMAFGPDGALYLVGNEEVGSTQTRFVIRRGTPTGDTWTWATVATSAPYLLSRTWFDHRANAIAVSPDGSTLIVNSGARTDHGESYGGVREEGLTALLLQVPADATDLSLPNDRAALRAGGYVFAEGIRNTADLTYAPNGDLFGPDNAGDRDDSEELNWLREGEHYGFPWRIGTSVTPMQFPDYDPEADLLIKGDRNRDNQTDTGWYFSPDPTYPAPPEGLAFADPIPNVGPYADKYRDEATGEIRDASDEGVPTGTFTGHRSPLGLVFDADSLVAGDHRGSAFMLSFNGEIDDLLPRMEGQGEDLIALDLNQADGTYTVSTTRVAHGFVHPVDAIMVENVVYVLEYGDWFDGGRPDRRSVWAVTLPRRTSTPTEDVPSDAAMTLAVAPNPASATVSLTYALPIASAVRLEIVDALGRVVRVAHEGDVPAGPYTSAVSTEGLPSGLYLARLVAGDRRVVRRLTVLR